MKKLRFINLIIGALLTCQSLISCGSDDNSMDEPGGGESTTVDPKLRPFLGVWLGTDGYDKVRAEFKANGIYTDYLIVDGKDRFPETGMYQVTGNKLYIPDSNLANIYGYEYYVSFASPEKMILTPVGKDYEWIFTRERGGGATGDDNDNNHNGGNGNKVTTAEASVENTYATFKVELSSPASCESAGILLSIDRDFAYSKKYGEDNPATKVVEVTKNGLLDDETYYYKAYATINGKDIYGEVKSFTTEPLTYSIDGVSYRFIKVKGGPCGDFSIMETEFPIDKGIYILGKRITRTSKEKYLTKGEVRDLLYNQLMAKTGYAWRFPTQGEWEYAARGGNKSKKFQYSGSNNIDDVAWYKSNCTRAHDVAEKIPNELGLYDMSGNFSETATTGIDLYIKELNFDTAVFFDTMWKNAIACGGNWSCQASECKPSSYYSLPSASSSNRIDATRVTLRLVYTRDPFYCGWTFKPY